MSTTRLDKSTTRLDKSTTRLDKSTTRLDKSTTRLDKSTIVYFEGNIGAGKTFNINLLKKYYSNEFIFLTEPVQLWKDIGIFDKYYKDKKRWAFTFQILSLISKIIRADEYLNTNKTLIIERSGFGDKIMFFDLLYKQKYISDIEHKIYELFFENIINKYKILNGSIRKFIICDAPDNILMKRIKERNREGELISKELIIGLSEQLHKKLIPELKKRNKKILILNTSEDIQDNEFLEKKKAKEMYDFII